MKRWLMLFASLGLATLALVLWVQEPQRRRERFERIQPGMTREEAVAIMGDVNVVIPNPPLGSCWGPPRPAYYVAVDEEGIVMGKWVVEKE